MKIKHIHTNPVKPLTSFLVQQGGIVAKKTRKKKRRNISNVVGGKAITEDEKVSRMKAYIEESARVKKKMPLNKTPTKPQNKKSSKTLNKSANKTPRESPQAKLQRKHPLRKASLYRPKSQVYVPSTVHSPVHIILCHLRMACQLMISRPSL